MVELFKIWGCPDKVRVDNGLPFGSPKPSTVSQLKLCLLAYGIEVKTNRPKVPQDNSKVERFQGTSMRWSEISKCQSLQQAQSLLDQAVVIQREQYPVSRLKNQTRLEAFPELKQQLKPWSPIDFKSQRVYDYLAIKQYMRKVSSNGQIIHFAHRAYVGAKWKGQYVCLKFNAFTLQWEVYASNGEFIRSIKASYLSSQRIKNMTVFSKNLDSGA